MVFERMELTQMEKAISYIDDVFGYSPMNYSEKEDILLFDNPIVIAESPQLSFLGVGIVKEDNEIKMYMKMFDSDNDEFYYTRGIEI
ncbi:MAG: hypothetical protein RR744_08315 [Cellulosilyticaceae bacterium]